MAPRHRPCGTWKIVEWWVLRLASAAGDDGAAHADRPGGSGSCRRVELIVTPRRMARPADVSLRGRHRASRRRLVLLTVLGTLVHADEAVDRRRPAFEVQTLSGRVVWYGEALQRRLGIGVVPEAVERVLALRNRRRSTDSADRGPANACISPDERLRAMHVQLRVRQLSGHSRRTNPWRVYELTRRRDVTKSTTGATSAPSPCTRPARVRAASRKIACARRKLDPEVRDDNGTFVRARSDRKASELPRTDWQSALPA